LAVHASTAHNSTAIFTKLNAQAGTGPDKDGLGLQGHRCKGPGHATTTMSSITCELLNGLEPKLIHTLITLGKRTR